MDCHDVWKYLSQWLNDADKFNLMITSHKMKLLNFLFNEEHHYKSIICSTFYENFTNIVIDNIVLLMKKKFITGCLPPYSNNVRQLRFSNTFNHKIESFMIPSTITHLNFGTSFEYEIGSDIIPNTVTHLVFGDRYRKNIIDCIPSSLLYLKIGSAIYEKSRIGKAVKGKSSDKININDSSESVKTLPSSITHLFWINNLKSKNIIPSSVKYLSINILTNELVLDSVTHLRIQGYKNITIFPNVTHLTIGLKFSQFLENMIPNGVTHIKFESQCFQFIISRKYIPSTVTHIFIDITFAGSLDSLPHTVAHLILPIRFSDPNNIKKTIKYVTEYESDCGYLGETDYPSVSEMVTDWSDDSDFDSYSL